MHVPKYRRHTAKDLGFVEWKGKRYYFSGRYDSTASREAYRQFLFRNVGAPPPDPEPPSSGFTVTALVVAYLKHAERFYGTGSRGEYANCKHALKPFGKRFAGIPAASFGPKALKIWQLELAAKKQARPYINAQCSKIKRAFKWAASEELIPVSVFQALCTVPGIRANRSEAREPSKRRPVPWGDVEPVLAELTPVVADMVRIQWHTAVRSGSLCRARVDQFEITQDVWIWRPRHKTECRGATLEVPIGPKCQAILKPYLQRARDGYLFDPRKQRKNRIYGKRYSTSSYYRAIQRAIERVNADLEKAGSKPLEPWFPHQLRHSKGQEVREVYGIEGAQAHLGHDSMEATELYSARRLELAKQIARETG